MKNMLVIGLGQFGYNLALRLSELGNEVLVVDTDSEKVEQIAPYVTGAQIADCQEDEVLKSLGIKNFDICFVCIAGDFQASLEITCALSELGAEFIVSKAERVRQSLILSKIGANEVIHADTELADKVAVRYSAENAFEFIELSDGYAISEILVPEQWIGKSIDSLNVRRRYGINIIAYKFGHERNKDFIPTRGPEHTFVRGEHLLLAGDSDDIMAMTSKLN